MGMSLGKKGGANTRRSFSRQGQLLSEINVTPFVDVMLVLLIIFMVAAPLMTVGVPIDLPETSAKSLDVDSVPIIVSVDRKGIIHLQENPVTLNEIVPKLRSIAPEGYKERIFIRGDKAADYGTIMKIMAQINEAGFRNIGLVSLSERGH